MIHLHNHTDRGSNLRLIDSINTVRDLVDRAVELGNKGIACTDHESVSSYVKFIQYVKEGKENNTIPKDFKLILGNEIYLVDEVITDFEGKKSCNTPFYHFILLAKDKIGNEQLRRLSTMAWQDSFYTGKMERTPTTKENLAKIVKENPGHLIASTACIGGELGKTILAIQEDMSYLPFIDEEYIQEHKGKLKHQLSDFLEYCYDLFGEDFYLEMQPSDNEEQTVVNNEIIKLSEKFNIPYIITCDSHYLKKEERPIHEAYLNSHEEEREVADFYATTYMMSVEEIHEYMDKNIGEENVNKALENTIKIGEKIEEYDLFHAQVVPKGKLPDFEDEHFFESVYENYPYIKKFAYSDNVYDRYFLHLIEKGWLKKEYREDLTTKEKKDMLDRIELEFEAIWESSEKIKDKISSYYVTALDIVNMMWDDSEDGGNSLVGCSRGSVAAYYTAYLINLQQINPMRYNIPYWRHLHYKRPELPDVDIDTEAGKRQRIIEATRKKFGYDRVLNICTFKTEGSKSAIITSCRGLGIDPDTAHYLASMIPVVRGENTSLKVMINGDEEEGIKPNVEFVNECLKYPRLLETALKIEGLVCGRSIHASGVIIFDNDFVLNNAMMKSTNGQATTQWDMEDSTYCGGLKYDYLTINNLDAMRACLDFLVEYGKIEWKGSLKETYNYYFHPDVLDYDSKEMWAMAKNQEIINLFQFQTQVGGEAIAKIAPTSLIELGVANSVMRLTAQEDKEQPIDTYVRYKNNISEWYDCMHSYDLTDEEISILEKYLKPVSGMATMQEEVMNLVMDENISNFDMLLANKLRKIIAKKKTSLHEQAKEMFYEHGLGIGTSQKMLDYIWEECVTPQLKYSFSLPHVMGYSTITVQEMNMAYRFPIIYWNAANLVVDSGSFDSGDNDVSTNYGKVATSIARLQNTTDTKIALPIINEAELGFKPDEENNQIIFGLKGLNGIGTEVVNLLIQNRPYTSMEDFYARMIETKLIKPAQMVKLIKAGCFVVLDNPDRVQTMKYYLKNYVLNPCEKLTMQQFNNIESMGILPGKYELGSKMKSFKDYIFDDRFFVSTWIDENSKRKLPKCGYNDRLFKLDDIAMNFFKKYFDESSIYDTDNGYYIVFEKKLTKQIEEKMKPMKEWFASEEALNAYNEALLERAWGKHANGSISKWEMESLSFYYTEHELVHMNEEMYTVVNFNDLPEEPEVYDTYTRYINNEKKQMPKFKIVRLAGTVLDVNKDRHTVTLLTNHGVVNCKFNKGQFIYYHKRISARLDPNSDKNTIIEDSWLKRGQKILVCGYRQDNTFRVYKYSDTIFKHTCNLITEVKEDGTVSILTEREKID